jgi:hypothetical protein
MKSDMSLPELLTEADAVARDVQSTFGHLTAEQLNWKPNAGSWSVAQCLDHLITINGPMLAGIAQALDRTKPARFLERLPFWSGLCGRIMVKALVPGGARKFKAPPKGQPSTSKLAPQIVGHFVSHQQEVIGKMKTLQNLQLEKIRMTSPFASFITYNLLDACRIIVVHERRHFAQAERVMATSGFPT